MFTENSFRRGFLPFAAVAVVIFMWSLPFNAVAQSDGHDHKEDEPTEVHEDDLHEGHGHDEADHADEGEDVVNEEDGHSDHEEEGIIEVTPEAMKMAGITLAKVGRGCIGNSVDLPGEVGFNEDRLAHIVPRFAGIAREVRFRVGDYVNAGDVVAIVESNESMSAYSIKAIISGWIIDRHVTPGEFVSGEHSIYAIADLSNVWVNLAVYPKDADRIKPGLCAFIEAVGSKTRTEGTIQYVTPVLDANTRSITARVVLPNPNNTWRPGTFVRARVAAGSGEEGLVVEKEAVQVLDNEHVVFVSEGPGRFKPVEVEVGDSDSLFIKILSGLEEGTEYAVAGAFELKAKIVTSSLGGHAGHGH